MYGCMRVERIYDGRLSELVNVLELGFISGLTAELKVEALR